MAFMTPEERLTITRDIGQFVIRGCKPLSERKFKAHFGLPTQMVIDIWDFLKTKKQKRSPRINQGDMLRFYSFCKCYPSSMEVLEERFHLDEDTIRKRLWLAAKLIRDNIVPPRWERRFRNWKHLCPSSAVDTKAIHCSLRVGDAPWKMVNKRREGKHPFVLYQFVTAFDGEIVHVDGPHWATAQDSTIAKDVLSELLEDGEKMLGDAGYRNATDICIAAPGGFTAHMTEEDKILAAKIHRGRAIVERAIGRLTNFGIFSGTWRYNLDFLEECVQALVILHNVRLEYQPLDKSV